MGRILSIDYGTKRTGIAVSDPLQIIASGLDTVATNELFEYLCNYINKEEVDCIVVGEPLQLNDEPSPIEHLIVGFIRKLEREFPQIKFARVDERFTSKEATKIIRQSGAKKKKRQDKGLVDKVSAVLILQDYMESIRT